MKALEFLYGIHAARALLKRRPEQIVRIHLAAGRHDARVQEIEALAQRHQREVVRNDAHELERLAGAAVHQGVVAEILPLPSWSEDDLLGALSRTEQPLVLALDGVQDPHNLGACLRTADACGALAVIVPKDRAAQLTATVRKVAAGAAETTPVVAVVNLVRCLKLLKEGGLWVIGADAGADQRAQDVDLCIGSVIVLGAEGSGLRQLTRQSCDVLVHLPQYGAVESLNVSVAAGMLLYEALRQRAGSAR